MGKIANNKFLNRKISEKMKIKSIIKDSILIILGTLLMAIGTNKFLLPNQISSGGFAGIATIFYYLFNWQMGTVVFGLNIPLFIYASFKIGKGFLIKTIIATALFSFFLNIIDATKVITNDKLLASIYAGIILGIGISLVFKAKSSTGGSDILAQIINTKKTSFNLSELLFFIDGIIILLNVIVFKDIEIGLYSILSIYVFSKLVDIVFEGIDFSKAIYIISDKPEEISDKINQEIERGITGLKGKGMYTQSEKLILLCVVTRKEIPKIKEIVKEIDKNAFIVIYNVREVLGEGF